MLRYEKLFGYCEQCGSLCHQEDKCPLLKGFKQLPQRNLETPAGAGGWHEGSKHDDRARSYKGVLINGPGSQHNREREAREYHGKGKGKMFEEADSKWVRVADRGNRRPSGNRGNNRGDREDLRNRAPRREESRLNQQASAKKEASGQVGVQQKQL